MGYEFIDIVTVYREKDTAQIVFPCNAVYGSLTALG